MNHDALIAKVAELKRQVEEIERLLKPGKDATPKKAEKGPLYGFDPTVDGFHVLKDKWSQKSYIKDHCEALLDGCLKQVIETTRQKAPTRSLEQGFFVSDEFRTPIEKISSGTERWLEAELFSRFGLSSSQKIECHLWKGLCARQVPLFDSIIKNGWGEVDLLAASAAGHPIVIELKLHKDANPEPPQRPLFEGVAYSIALNEVWNAFWPQWEGFLEEFECDRNVVFENRRIDVVLLAPDAYWNHWLIQPQYIQARSSYSKLIHELGNEGIQVTIAGIQIVGSIPTGIQKRRDFIDEE